MSKRVGFFIYRYPISISLPVINTAKILAENGFKVDILSEREVFEKPIFNNKNIKIFYANSHIKISRITDNLLQNITRKFADKQSLPRPPDEELGVYFNFCRLFVQKTKINYIIGFDTEGSLAAHLVSQKYKIPYCIYSLEINPERKLKSLEKKALKKADFLIIQDEKRRNIYNKQIHLPRSRFILVPVGDLGPVNLAKTDFLRRKFHIPLDKKIILHLGSITEWSCTTELAASVETWPENAVLVFHGIVKTQKYLDEIKFFQNKFKNRIFLSLDFLPARKLDELISSADVGVAFYKTNCEDQKINIREITFSSGKIASYFKNSLPVITFNTKSLSAIIAKEEGGICVNKISQIPKAITKIIDKYPLYTKNSRRCFYKYYDYSVSFQKVIKKVNDKINDKR